MGCTSTGFAFSFLKRSVSVSQDWRPKMWFVWLGHTCLFILFHLGSSCRSVTAFGIHMMHNVPDIVDIQDVFDRLEIGTVSGRLLEFDIRNGVDLPLVIMQVVCQSSVSYQEGAFVSHLVL
jgi:hypothetical protein